MVAFGPDHPTASMPHKNKKLDRNSAGPGPQRTLRILGAGLVLVLGACLAWNLYRTSQPGTDNRSADNASQRFLTTPPATNGIRTSTPGKQASADAAAMKDEATCHDSRQNQWDAWDNPKSEGWDTEVFHGQAKKQLKQLGKLMASASRPLEAKPFQGLVTTTMTTEPLVPASLAVAYEGPQLKVLRETPAATPTNNATQQPPGNGSVALATALNPLLDLLTDSVHVHFKVFRVSPGENSATTRQFVEISGNTEHGSCEQHAIWTITWTLDEADHPLIQSITSEDFQRITLQQDGKQLFADCTASVLKNNPSYHQQLLQGYDDWLHRMQEERYLFVLSTPGIAIGDVNGDGLEDLYLCQENGLANRLYLQDPDGSLRDASESWNCNFLEWSRSALLVDLDNDGDRDLVIAILGGVLLMENQDQQSFRLRTVLPTIDDLMSLSAADYDQDGLLDLYVCGYLSNMKPDDIFGAPVGLGGEGALFQDDNHGGANILLNNEITDSKWSFKNVSEETGLDVHGQRYSFAAAWEDYDNDGDQDLYVANDFGHNCLYRHDIDTAGNHKFSEIASQTNTQDTAGGMSVTWADYDHDGWMDLYVSNMYSSAGNRIAFQPHFGKNFSESLRKTLQRFARGNTLMRNRGKTPESELKFDDFGQQSGTTMGRWAWGSNFADINNDGWDDLLVANGFVTSEDTGDL